jgi:hypothetical protein
MGDYLAFGFPKAPSTVVKDARVAPGRHFQSFGFHNSHIEFGLRRLLKNWLLP